MLFLQYDASGNITGRFTITDSSQIVNYSNTLTTSVGMHDKQPEIWAIVQNSAVLLSPKSSTATGTIAIIGAAAEAEVNSVALLMEITGVNTARIVMSFAHALSAVNTQQANAALYVTTDSAKPAVLVYSGGFTSSNVVAVFSASAITAPLAIAANLKLALGLIGLNMNVSSRVLITQDATI